MRAHFSERQLRDVIRCAALEKEQHATASHAIGSEAFVAFDTRESKELLVEARGAIEVIHINGGFEDSGQRRHVLKSRTG